ncbi:MAG TPA: hypothetical protein VLA87_12870 [Gaiellaceae bacterium]|nr:hypothetical protein [Gaiellaceae bacterium]
MPDRRSIFRLLALAGFLLSVGLALWLAELRPLLVVVVMAVALLVAWIVEWLWWRRNPGRPAAESADVSNGEVAIPVLPPPLAVPEPEPAHAKPEEAEEAEASPGVEAAAAPSEPAPPQPGLEPEQEARPEPRRPTVRLVPTPPASGPRPAAATPPQPARPRDVIDLRTRVTAQPRRWNLWDLEHRARDEAQRDPLRYEEWSFLFVHLRQFVSPDGSLPIEFDGLVRESFGELLDHAG